MKKLILFSLILIGCAKEPEAKSVTIKLHGKMQPIRVIEFTKSANYFALVSEVADTLVTAYIINTDKIYIGRFYRMTGQMTGWKGVDYETVPLGSIGLNADVLNGVSGVVNDSKIEFKNYR